MTDDTTAEAGPLTVPPARPGRADEDRVSKLLLDLRAQVPGAATAFADLVHPYITAFVEHETAVLRRHAALDTLGRDVHLAAVPEADVPDLARDVASTACTRLIKAAGRFDPTQGPAMTWVIGATKQAFISECQRRQGRSKLQIDLTEDMTGLQIAEQRTSGNPEAAVLAAEEFRAALSGLDAEAREVWMLRNLRGWSRAVIAEQRYPQLESGGVTRVDSVLRRAKRHLLAAGEEFGERTGAHREDMVSAASETPTVG